MRWGWYESTKRGVWFLISGLSSVNALDLMFLEFILYPLRRFSYLIAKDVIKEYDFMLMIMYLSSAFGRPSTGKPKTFETETETDDDDVGKEA